MLLPKQEKNIHTKLDNKNLNIALTRLNTYKIEYFKVLISDVEVA